MHGVHDPEPAVRTRQGAGDDSQHYSAYVDKLLEADRHVARTSHRQLERRERRDEHGGYRR